MKLIVSGGGTGGHIYPGVAVAEEIMRSSPGSSILFIGTDRAADKRAFAGGRFTSTTLKCHGLKGKSLTARLKSLVQLPLSLAGALKLVNDFKPDLVLGVGGYVTGPVLLAAKILGKTTCIHEQNSVPGLANRMIGKFVNRVFITYPDSEEYFPAGKCKLTGNPVRKNIVEASHRDGRRRSFTAEGRGSFTLGVLGGSLGAHRINTLVVDMLISLEEGLDEGFRVFHQTGPADENMVQEAYRAAGVRARVSCFFENMADFYRQVDLVISRAGATSLAEITVMGIPALLIPYPLATDDHQRKNGEFMVREGAAKMFSEDEATRSSLAEEFLHLLHNEKDRMQMAEVANRLARPDALNVIVKECQKMVMG